MTIALLLLLVASVAVVTGIITAVWAGQWFADLIGDLDERGLLTDEVMAELSKAVKDR